MFFFKKKPKETDENIDHRVSQRIDDKILKQLDTHRLLMYKLEASNDWKTFSLIDFSASGILFKLRQEDDDPEQYQAGTKHTIKLNFLHTHQTVIEAEAEIIRQDIKQEKGKDVIYIAATYPSIKEKDKEIIDSFVNSFNKPQEEPKEEGQEEA